VWPVVTLELCTRPPRAASSRFLINDVERDCIIGHVPGVLLPTVVLPDRPGQRLIGRCGWEVFPAFARQLRQSPSAAITRNSHPGAPGAQAWIRWRVVTLAPLNRLHGLLPLSPPNASSWRPAFSMQHVNLRRIAVQKQILRMCTNSTCFAIRPHQSIKLSRTISLAFVGHALTSGLRQPRSWLRITRTDAALLHFWDASPQRAITLSRSAGHQRTTVGDASAAIRSRSKSLYRLRQKRSGAA
jgi:hypothetical protein